MPARLATLTEAKNFLRIGNDDVDGEVQILLNSCEDIIAEHCGVLFNNTTITDEYVNGGGTELLVRFKPLISVSAITDVVADTAVDVVNYCVDRNRIHTTGGLFWVDGRRRYKVTYLAGYHTAERPAAAGSTLAPAGFRAPLLTLLRRTYEERGDARSIFFELVKSDTFAMLNNMVKRSRF